MKEETGQLLSRKYEESQKTTMYAIKLDKLEEMHKYL